MGRLPGLPIQAITVRRHIQEDQGETVPMNSCKLALLPCEPPRSCGVSVRAAFADSSNLP